MRTRLVSFFVMTAILLISTAALAEKYAVIYSGGYNIYNNHDRYYEETLRMWQLTTGTLGYDMDNVYVLFADGTNPAADRSSGENSDWSAITAAGGHIDGAAYGDLQSTLASLATTMTASDSFYFWSFDHGDGGTLDTGSLVAWGDTWVRDDVFASWVSPFTVQSQAYAFGQCFAGDMADDLFENAYSGKLFAAWAADYYEYSWDRSWADAWADGIESGLTLTNELGDYAITYDIDGPYGSGAEHPGWRGENFDISNDTPDTVPEPSTLLLLGAGLVGIAALRKRFSGA